MSCFLKSVLLIDDDEIDNIINTKIIKLNEFADVIIVKQSTEDALEYLFNEFNTNNKVPDLIFLDIRMPLMDGFDFLKAFNNLDENIKNKTKIIMLTSSIDNGDFSHAKGDKNIFQIIKKPLSFESLNELRKKL